MRQTLKPLTGLAAATAATLLFALPAVAGGSLKDTAPAAKERCSYSANTALTTEYIFRGFSQSAGAPAVQGGFDVTCGIFYTGIWASSIDFGKNRLASADSVAKLEMDWYAGFKPTTGPISWDFGVIYYTYPNASTLQNNGINANLNYLELKAGASFAPWKDATLGQTIFWSPDYQLESGQAWTFETSFSQNLPKVGIFSPTFSALYGYQLGSDTVNYRTAFGNTGHSYSYWNAGLTLGFREKWALDFRYWDTNISNAGNFCKGDIFQCDQRYVASLKFTF